MPIQFGTIIRDARTAKGLTQQQLADQLGVKNTTISNWEKNRSQPDSDKIERLCSLLGLTPDALYGQESAPTLTFDDFTYALYNEARELTPENQEKLLEMAQFFRQKQEQENR